MGEFFSTQLACEEIGCDADGISTLISHSRTFLPITHPSKFESYQLLEVIHSGHRHTKLTTDYPQPTRLSSKV
jgi:hypothetical protein